MRNIYITLAVATLLSLTSCGEKTTTQRVMARYVPERMDDFVFENNLIAGRIYGEALEGETLSPGIDIWVKMPDRLVADAWYAGAQEDGSYYHRNHGDGKDCYKVSKSLGGGASAPVIDGALCYPATNYRSYEMLRQTDDTVEFVLSYPEWQIGDLTVALDKKVTVAADSYFCKVEDSYTFTGTETLPIAAGFFRHPDQETIVAEETGEDCVAIWEHASDQSVEEEEGMIGVAVVMPGCDEVGQTLDGTHSVCVKTISSGEPLVYYFGSCWSAANIQTPQEWFDLVLGL